MITGQTVQLKFPGSNQCFTPLSLSLSHYTHTHIYPWLPPSPGTMKPICLPSTLAHSFWMKWPTWAHFLLMYLPWNWEINDMWCYFARPWLPHREVPHPSWHCLFETGSTKLWPHRVKVVPQQSHKDSKFKPAIKALKMMTHKEGETMGNETP